MKLLVVIVTYNAMRWAERCFDSLRKSTVVPDVFVVDNGSTDGTQEYIKKNYPEVLFQQSKENLGFGKANNLGMQYALDNDYDYVYLLNQDAWVMPDTFQIMIDAHKKNSEYGILSPVQVVATKDKFDKNFGIICRLERRKCNLLDNLYFGTNAISDITCVMAAHWLVSRDCLYRVGGFSPAFPHYDEDDNYAERAVCKGFKIGIVHGTMAVHDRENREYSRDFLIYKSYINSIRTLSSIHSCVKYPWLSCAKVALWNSIKYFSLKPICNFMKLLHQRNYIKKCKNESLNDCAFLNCKKNNY